jgi:DNA-binding LytR/AlgR family response regulator
MIPIKCIIVDDEYPARILMKNYIDKLPQLELIGSFQSPVEVMASIDFNSIDLMFLDIQMPDITGIEFVKSLKVKPAVVFTTAYPDYALEGYNLDVMDYLVKPIAFNRFLQTVNKASEWINIKGNAKSIGHLTEISKEYISVKADHKIYRVHFDDILYIEGLAEYVSFYTTKGKIITLESLKNLEIQLPAQQFVRVHKSYIVNKKKVNFLYGNQLEINGVFIPLGKSYKEEAIKVLF